MMGQRDTPPSWGGGVLGPACSPARGCVGVCRSDPIHEVTSLLSSDGDLEMAIGAGGGYRGGWWLKAYFFLAASDRVECSLNAHA